MTAATSVAAWPRPSARVEPGRLAPGQQGRLVVTLEIPDGCHVQSHTPKEPFLIPTSLHLDDSSDAILGPVVYPPAHTERFDWTPVELDVYRDTVEILLPVEIPPHSSVGTTTISGHVRYQGCTETACLPPVEHPIEARFEIISDRTVKDSAGKLEWHRYNVFPADFPELAALQAEAEWLKAKTGTK